MFKQFGKFLISILMLVAVMAPQAFAQKSGDGDSWVPWPWGYEAPFPWADVHGMWRVDDGDSITYFAFKVAREKTTKGRQLVVKQMDAETCKLVATGVGYESENIIRAQMTGRNGTYRVIIRAFSIEDAPVPPAKSQFVMDSVMVISITNLDWAGQTIHLQLTKVSDSVTQRACLDAEKNKK